MVASRRTSTICLAIVLVVSVLMVLIYAEDQIAEEIAPGRPAPNFELIDLDGSKRSLRDLRGRVVFINFWATWCKPCEDEMPAMERLYSDLSDEQFEMLAISVDSSSGPVFDFRKDLGLSFPILLDTDRKVANRYQSFKFPETYLIDPNGILVARFVGPREWDSALYSSRIRNLIR